MPAPRVVMLDFDGVLLREDYSLNVTQQQFLQEIAALRQTGIILVPNTDTPVLRIRDLSDKCLGFQPRYMVAERGAVVVTDEQKKLPLGIADPTKFRRDLFRRFLFDCLVMQGDSVATMRNFNLFSPNRKILFIDMIREQTLGFYARVSDREGVSRPDHEWMCEVKSIVDQLPLPAGLLPFAYNPGYGIAIANAANCSKTTGYLEIRKAFPESDFYMVGDTLSDWIDDKSVVQCAVANASAKYKDECAFVADTKYSEGLLEVLKWICAQ